MRYRVRVFAAIDDAKPMEMGSVGIDTETHTEAEAQVAVAQLFRNIGDGYEQQSGYPAVAEVDYRELLVKYIAHVGECEGTSFIGHNNHYFTMTPEEDAILRELDAEGRLLYG